MAENYAGMAENCAGMTIDAQETAAYNKQKD